MIDIQKYGKIIYKIQKILVLIGIILMVTDYIILGIFYILIKTKKTAPVYFECGKLVIMIIATIALILIMVYPITIILNEVMRGIGNIKRCDDPVFDEIEGYLKHWGNNNYHYMRVIGIINLFYSEDGRINKEIKKNKEINRLYSRLDYLRLKSDFIEELKSNLMALVLSIIASAMFSFLGESFYETKEQVFSKDIIIVFVLLIFVVATTLIWFSYRGRDNEGLNFIREYEIDKLTNYIINFENEIIIESKDEEIIKNQNDILQELISIASKKWQNNESVVADINVIEKLNLCLDSYEECEFRKCKRTKTKNKVEVSNFILFDKKGNYVSDNYKKLYEILNKYGWTLEKKSEEAEK